MVTPVGLVMQEVQLQAVYSVSKLKFIKQLRKRKAVAQGAPATGMRQSQETTLGKAQCEQEARPCYGECVHHVLSPVLKKKCSTVQ